MHKDNKTTQFNCIVYWWLTKYNITLRTVLHCRTALGWTFCGSAYCQLIRETNKDKRLAWAQAHLHETFDNVTWTDECTIQLETHRRFCCRKQGEPPRPKLRYSTFHVGDYYVIYLYVHVIHSILLPCK